MLEKKLLKEHLEKSSCHKCGYSMSTAKVVPISNAPLGFIAHAVCQKCRAESMITITQAGSGSIPVRSDLKSPEITKFIGRRSVTYDELLDLHLFIEKNNIWNLVHKKEKSLENKPKQLKRKEKSQL